MPVLALGPRESHLGEIVAGHALGEVVDHGDVEGAAAAIRRLAGLAAHEREAFRTRARQLADTEFKRAALIKRVCEIVEQGGVKN